MNAVTDFDDLVHVARSQPMANDRHPSRSSTGMPMEGTPRNLTSTRSSSAPSAFANVKRMLRRAAKVPTEQPVASVIASFVVSRIAYFLAGVRFVTGDVRGNVWQLLDFHLLRDNPISSIWNLHSQPPLYNAFVAFVLQFPTGAQRTLVAVCWLVLGLVTVIASYLLLVELRVPRLGALIVTIIAVVMSPSYVLYENFGYSAYPCACLLVVTALFLARYFRTGSWRAGLGFACGTTSIVLLNSSYQWVWLVVVVLIPLLAL